jgi:hypothetical protein
MAKLIPRNESTIFQNKIADYLKKSTEEYSKFFEGRATFVTLFSKNMISSFHESTLDNSVELIGQESTIRYNKYQNFPLWQFPTLDLNLDEGEMGLNTEINGECVILPESKLEPLVDDYFYLDGLPEHYLFRINKVNYDKISGKQYYKIEFTLEFYDMESVDKQVVDVFIGDYNQFTGFIKKTDYEILQEIDSFIETISDFGKKYFYNTGLNYFYFSSNNLKFYDPSWTKFCIKNNIWKNDDVKKSLEDLYLNEIDLGDDYTPLIDSYYNNTIFKFFEDSSRISLLSKLNYTLTGNPKITNELYYEQEQNGIILYLNDSSKTSIFDEDFLEKLTNKELYEDTETYCFENLLINYYDSKITKENIIANIEEINYESNDFKTFIFIPFILKILKEIRNNLLI